MPQKQYVRETSPYMQAFLVDLARDYYRALLRGDWRRALLALSMLYDSMPSTVRNEIDRELGRAGLEGFLGIRGAIEETCKKIMTRYGERTQAKIAECNRQAFELLQAAYSVIMSKAYAHNIFFTMKSIEIGIGMGEE